MTTYISSKPFKGLASAIIIEVVLAAAAIAVFGMPHG